MAFTTLSDTLIQVGKAVKREIFSTIKDNEDDLNSRLNSVESSIGKIVIFDGVVLNASSSNTLTGMALHRVQAPITLTDTKIGIFLMGSLTGSLEIDLQKSSSLDFTTSTSVFTTKPLIDFDDVGTTDYFESSNAVFNNSEIDLLEGEWLRFDITSLPASGILGSFTLYIIGEPT